MCSLVRREQPQSCQSLSWVKRVTAGPLTPKFLGEEGKNRSLALRDPPLQPVKASPLYTTARKQAQQSAAEPLALFLLFAPLLLLSESSAKIHPTNSSLSANDGVELGMFTPCWPILVQQKLLLGVTRRSQVAVSCDPLLRYLPN